MHKAETIDEVAELAEKMCGQRYVSSLAPGENQSETGSSGFICKCVLIMEELAIDKEFFVSVGLDPHTQSPVITYAKHGELPFS